MSSQFPKRFPKVSLICWKATENLRPIREILIDFGWTTVRVGVDTMFSTMSTRDIVELRDGAVRELRKRGLPDDAPF